MLSSDEALRRIDAFRWDRREPFLLALSFEVQPPPTGWKPLAAFDYGHWMQEAQYLYEVAPP